VRFIQQFYFNQPFVFVSTTVARLDSLLCFPRFKHSVSNLIAVDMEMLRLGCGTHISWKDAFELYDPEAIQLTQLACKIKVGSPRCPRAASRPDASSKQYATISLGPRFKKCISLCAATL
jgi:hypothetical protein